MSHIKLFMARRSKNGLYMGAALVRNYGSQSIALVLFSFYLQEGDGVHCVKVMFFELLCFHNSVLFGMLKLVFELPNFLLCFGIFCSHYQSPV